MLLVDTNIFLEVLLSQHKKDQYEVFLDQLRSGIKIGVITDFSIHSIIVIMYSLSKLKELQTFLLSLTAYKGLKIYSTTLTDEINAATIALTQN
jgi:predicted nucleic acid-binding protein